MESERGSVALGFACAERRRIFDLYRDVGRLPAARSQAYDWLTMALPKQALLPPCSHPAVAMLYSSSGDHWLRKKVETMQEVTIDEAKTRLQDLIEAALEGETVSIAKDETHAVQLVPVIRTEGRPQFGSTKGMIWMADDFDAPLEDFKEYME
jgi:antitoxin (DNA-binding transcriptional repressor) of toxin-antitoxin stability system